MVIPALSLTSIRTGKLYAVLSLNVGIGLIVSVILLVENWAEIVVAFPNFIVPSLLKLAISNVGISNPSLRLLSLI